MSDSKQAFGETLRQLRTKDNRTQQDIAMSCEMSLRFYQDLEAGNKQPSMTTIFRLAGSLEVQPSKLIEPAYEQWESAD